MDGKSNSYVYCKTVISSQLRNNAWYRDSHGLFDYNASWYSESEIYVEGSCFLNRDINDCIQLSEYNLDIEFDDTYRSEYEHSKTLASLAEIGGDYYLFHKASKIISNREKIWWVIKSFKTNKHGFRGHLLQKADKIRFGRLVYYVRDISSDPSNERDRENYDKNLINETKFEGDNIQEIMNSLENSHNNSPRIYRDTENVQGELPTFPNQIVPRLARRSLNSENVDANFIDQVGDQLNQNFLDHLPTERENNYMLNSGLFLSGNLEK